MKKQFGWAIIGPGAIAHRFADAVHQSDNAYIAAVQGRSLDRASEFARTWTRDGVKPIRATDSLASLLDDPQIDGVYIATPHPFHAHAITQCLRARKPVLCEKPLVTDAHTAAELCALARTNNTFLMEAVWTRFLPVYDVVGQWLRDGAIGAVRSMQSSFCFNAPWNPSARHFDPAQAGGALLDIGVYNLTVTRWVMQAALGRCPDVDSIDARALIGPTGVDHRLTATLNFPGGVTSQFVCGFDSDAENAFHIFGEHATIILASPFWGATAATLAQHNADPITISRPFRINGFEYEIEEAMRCIGEGRIESERISHAETHQTLQWMDHIRRDIGVRYPFDKQNNVLA
jgi:predicted dehydrogenase